MDDKSTLCGLLIDSSWSLDGWCYMDH